MCFITHSHRGIVVEMKGLKKPGWNSQTQVDIQEVSKRIALPSTYRSIKKLHHPK